MLHDVLVTLSMLRGIWQRGDFAYAPQGCSSLHLQSRMQNALLGSKGMPEVAMTFSKDDKCLTLLHTTGAGQKSKKKGAGTKMLDDLKKKGKPVTPKLEEMALWLDSLDTSTMDDGQVSQTFFVQNLL